LLLHLFAGRYYGYFCDELYYLTCSQHLAWGYVDQPPLFPFLTKLVTATIGDSLSAIRLIPALAGTAKVLLAGLIAREFGGRRFAQGMAALCVLLSPGNLALDNLFTMNSLEPLSWMGCAWLVIRIIRTGNAKLWLWFGVVAGLSLENKHSMLIFGAGLAAGLIFTRERRWLRSPWFWCGGLIAFLLFLPNLLWNVHNHFPFLELQENIRRSGRNVSMPPLKFISEEILAMLPLSAPVWFAGLWWFFGTRDGKAFRALGWAWLIAAAIIMAANPRTYYLFPAFPLLFAAGGVMWEHWLSGPRVQWIKPVYVTLMIAMGALLAPTMIPILPPETYIRYSAATHLQQQKIENHDLGPLPQLFADQFGWPEMTAKIAGVYNNLPPEVRAKTAIFARNYSQGGALDHFGPQYGLPPAISGHQNYFLWGPRGYTGESMIVMQGEPDDLAKLFTSVEVVAHVSHPYSMPYQHFDVYYCRGMKMPLSEYWPHVKIWD
jgi:Dolichyl-phosphate-mannose-protein mannosyltransferase